MYFGLSEEQQFFKDNVNKFLNDHASLDIVKKIIDNNDLDIKNEIANGILNLGINSLLVPEKYGGLGLDLLFAAAVSQSLGENVAPFSFAGSYVMAPIALSLGGNEDQKNKYLNSIVNNKMKFAVGFSEYIAARNNFGFLFKNNTVSGKSIFVLDVENSTHLLIADEAGQIGVININDKNIKLTELTTVDKTRTYFEIQFEKALVDILEETKSNINAVTRSIDAGRIVLAADSLGASEALLTKAVEYSKERKQFGRAIGSFQAIKHMCAEMAADLEPCYSLVWHAAHCFDNIPDESRLMSCHAKSHVSDVSKVIAKKATEVHGGMGFTDLMGIHYWFKRIGVNRQNLGSPETIREEAAKIQNL
ncbi:acyl-CoA/acyl-ACP dehydrogenase [Gammaproteobacteria bacterium]|jgi:alkylation response protein AidB-like acyl-CoA dehydrogenase|nr:acyl-CoA/acyl-ACP dehydrogenase [Gammaproteobacteria bacterium]MDB2604595.1 acyl-CoA/acyl-ACP dehydrogenase [Gammaproteobacteria bacterium]MDC0347728.1 acyl-CoA/acyl-ACP dehydrogenase [Gammaproteobacteria bacterium]MDC1241907.1 acyl-CoA/acyl-ACP dehydrogenase [Gammaproteobacteria bacterium]